MNTICDGQGQIRIGKNYVIASCEKCIQFVKITKDENLTFTYDDPGLNESIRLITKVWNEKHGTECNLGLLDTK